MTSFLKSNTEEYLTIVLEDEAGFIRLILQLFGVIAVLDDGI